MPENVVTDFILVIAAVIVGLVIFGFVVGYMIPKINFTTAQQTSSQLASQMSIVIGPSLISKNGYLSFVIGAYDPSYSRNYTILVFTTTTTYLPSIGILTPQSQVNYQVILPNNKTAKQVTVSNVYDINGNQLTSSPYPAYTIPSNTPVTVNVNPQQNSVIVVWVLTNINGYWFRLGYTYTTTVS
jgi:hypothetical protein